jgi:hypothetical protein
MRGPFGGELEEPGDAISLEPASPDVMRALHQGAPREAAPELPASLRVELVTFDAREDPSAGSGHASKVCFLRAIGHATSLGALARLPSRRSDALDALGRVAAATAVLHAAETSHGELGLGLETILVDEAGRVLVLTPRTRPAPGALLAAVLRSGAPPSATAFAAPEVVTGYEAKGPSDVYAIAAMAHTVITGRPPLGQIDFGAARAGPFAELAPVVEAGLAANPAARPSAQALASALGEAAEIAHRLEEPTQAGPYRAGPAAAAAPAVAPRAQSPAQAAAARADASSMSGILTLLLVVGGLFVFTGAVWLVGVTWSALDGAGRFLLLLTLTSGILGAGVALGRKGYAGSGRAGLLLGVELLWADGAYLLDFAHRVDESGSWALLAAVMTLVAYVLAVVLDSALFGSFAVLHYAVFAASFGAYIHSGSPIGPATYALAVAGGAAVLAAIGESVRGARVGVPFAGFASLLVAVSALLGVALLPAADQRTFATVWPYAVAGLAALAAVGLRDTYGLLAAIATGTILSIFPTTEALLRSDTLAYLLGAVAIGFAIVVAAFTWPRIAREPGAQAAWVLVGLASAVTGPSLLFLVKCWDKDGLDALASPNGVYLGLVLVVSAALVGLSYLLGKRATLKLNYRFVELAGLLMLFGTFTLQSLARSKDSFYPLVILGVGTACVVVGATTKRATLVLLASGALLLNLSIQYFAKLWDVFPASLLVLVFGLALLAGGVLYERRLKHLLPGLREWA